MLGSAATTQQPPSDCAEAVANWTAVNGPVWVTVNADGPTTVTVTVNGTLTKSANIAPGQSTHIFQFPEIQPGDVSRVLATATSSPQEVGGSCVVTGSPTN